MFAKAEAKDIWAQAAAEDKGPRLGSLSVVPSGNAAGHSDDEGDSPLAPGPGRSSRSGLAMSGELLYNESTGSGGDLEFGASLTSPGTRKAAGSLGAVMIGFCSGELTRLVLMLGILFWDVAMDIAVVVVGVL